MSHAWAEAISAHAVGVEDSGPGDRRARCARGRCAHVLPAARALGSRRGRPADHRRTRIGSSGCRRGRRACARDAGRAARAVPARARRRHRRGTLLVRGAERGGADRLGAGARLARASSPRPTRWPPRTSSWQSSCGRSKGSRPPSGSRRARIAARSGPASSTYVRTSSDARRTTCTHSPHNSDANGARAHRRRFDQRRFRRADGAAPQPGETVPAHQLNRLPGGKGANQAVAAARLGAKVRMIGAVGDDPLAEEAVAGLVEAASSSTSSARARPALR